MLDLKVTESAKAIRAGSSTSAACRATAPAAPPPEDERAETAAAAAPLSEHGYKLVAAMKSHPAMEAFVRRVVSNMGCRVADESKLQGVVPFYSGESAVQSHAALEAEVYRACTGSGTWLASMYPRDAMTAQAAQQSSVASTLGSTAPLNEEGFQQVVALKDHLQMLKYVRRVVGMLHGWVVDESGIHGIVPFYSGEKATQTLGALIMEVQTAMQMPDGWVMRAHARKAVAALLEKGADDDVPAAPLGAEDPEVAERLQAIAARAGKGGLRAFQDCPMDDLDQLHQLNHTAWMVPLDEKGYQALVQLKSDCAMMQFTLRVIGDIHCKVLDESGLRGMVPFFSGTQGIEDMHELRTELSGACSMEGNWLVPDVKYWVDRAEVQREPLAGGPGAVAPHAEQVEVAKDVQAVPQAEVSTEQATRDVHAKDQGGPKTQDLHSLSDAAVAKIALDDLSRSGETAHAAEHAARHVPVAGRQKGMKAKELSKDWMCRTLNLFCD